MEHMSTCRKVVILRDESIIIISTLFQHLPALVLVFQLANFSSLSLLSQHCFQLLKAAVPCEGFP